MKYFKNLSFLMFTIISTFTLLSACKTTNPQVDLFATVEPNTPTDQKQYLKVLQKWTRSKKVYREMDDIIFVDATYHSKEFRKTFANRFPDVYGHGGTITKRELVDLPGELKDQHTFFLSAYTSENSWNDLDETDSIWRLSLTDGNHEVKPDEIIKIKIDANLKTIYPHIGNFDDIYLVRFPVNDAFGNIVISSQSPSFELRIASSLGTAALNWDLKQSVEPVNQ